MLRSDAQARVLATLLVAPPDPPLHVSALARRTGLPFSTVQREVDRLEQAGLITTERFASARVLRPNEQSPLIDDLRSLLLKTHGPAHVLARALEDIPEVDDAYLFGSWAARYKGEPGSPPGDIDVLIVGTPSLDAVDAASRGAEEQLGREVQATVVSPEEWKQASSGFLRTIRRRPLVRIGVGDDA